MEDFDPDSEAEQLLNAIKPKKDEDKIISLVASRTNEERLKIKDIYNAKYNSDLIKDLKKALHFNFENVIIGLFYSPIDYDCFQLRKALKGITTDDDALIEILCTRQQNTIEEINKRYSEMYPERTLIKDIEGKTSGDFKKILTALLLSKRPRENKSINSTECEECAKQLDEAFNKKSAVDEEIFLKFFTEKAQNEFIYISQLYHKLTKKTLLETVEKKFSRNLKKCLVAIIYSMLNLPEYFSKCIYNSIKGPGTDDSTLIRIIISRKEIDLPLIKQFYKQNYKVDMIQDIKGDTSGNYRKLLVELTSSY